jgi:hypothetical protein
MAVVFTPDRTGQAAQPVALSGGYWLLAGTLTYSASYATNGDPLDLTPYFPAGKTIRAATVLCEQRGFAPEYDVVNKKLKLTLATAATPTMAEHAAAAYAATMTATPIPVTFLLKG